MRQSPASSRRGIYPSPSGLSAIAIAIPLFFFAASASAQPRIPTHVACVGDSLTLGFDTDPGKDYPSDLQGLIGSSVVVKNFGADGTTMLTTGDAPYENVQAYKDAQTFVAGAGASAIVDVIIMFGSNDSKAINWTPQGKPEQNLQFATDTAAMVQTFASLPTHPTVFLVLPPYAPEMGVYGIDGVTLHDQIIPVLNQVAAQKGLPTIDTNTPTSKAWPADYADGVHPNDMGAALLAQLMLDGLLRVPTVTLTSPTAGAGIAAPVLLAATASGGNVAIEQVEFFEGMTSLGVATKSPFSISWTTATVGTHNVTATATDETTAAATSQPVSFEVTQAAPGEGGDMSQDSGADSGCSVGGGAENSAEISLVLVGLVCASLRLGSSRPSRPKRRPS